jgi:hypothetical protein
MKSYIAVAPATQSRSTPNSGANSNSNDVPIVGLGGAGVVISLVSILIGKWMPWGEIAKQFAGVRTSKVLQAENRKGQELEAEIDINQGLADTISQIAKHSADSSEFVIKDLLHLVGDAIQSSTANAHSTQALSRASESQVQATEDLIKATTHNSEALKALKEAIASIPKETASVIEVYAAEFRVALDLLDDRLDRIEKNQKLFSTQVKEEFASAFLELRRALKAKETG